MEPEVTNKRKVIWTVSNNRGFQNTILGEAKWIKEDKTWS